MTSRERVAEIQLKDSIECSLEAFWAAFVDGALQQRIFSVDLGYPSGPRDVSG